MTWPNTAWSLKLVRSQGWMEMSIGKFSFAKIFVTQRETFTWSVSRAIISDSVHNLLISLIPSVMIISVLFLLATVLVYAFLGELKSVADKSFLCFVAALTLTYASYPLLVFNFDDFEEMISSWIFFIGLFCSLLWLNVLVFDIWWTFRWVKLSWVCFRFVKIYL